MKICVYAIALNEAQFVDRFIDSAIDADLVLIADTGSTDETVQKIMAYKSQGRAKIASLPIHIRPWRFDLARNAAMAVIPADIDVCVSLDLDEVLQPGWREEIERVWELGKTTRMKYLFNWGGPAEFYYEKIHARFGYKWHHPCHEYPMPYGIDEVYAQSDKLLVVHKSDPTKSRHQYLKLLKMSVEEDPHCPRNAFYYAREHTFGYEGCDLNEAIRQADRYLALPGATWTNERSYAYRVKAIAAGKLGMLGDAETNWIMATREAPFTREPWIGLSELCKTQNRWPECYAFAKRALELTDKGKLYTTDHDAWGHKPHLLACLGAWYIGLRDEAIRHASDALEHDPSNEMLQKNILIMKEIIAKEQQKAA